MIKKYSEFPGLVKDKFYNRCVNLAKTSKSKGERYGAILVKDGEILGEGYNRAIVLML